MGIVTVNTFTSDTETVTRTKLNGLAANLVTEFNGSIDNDNIKAAAGIAYSKLTLTDSIVNADVNSSAAIAASKLDLTTLSQTIDASGSTWSDLGAVTTVDINGGSVDAITLGTNSAVTSAVFTTVDINAGTVDATIGATTPAAGTFTVLTGNTSLSLATGATVTGIADEDDMSSDSDTLLATQQSIKAYVDNSPTKNTDSCFSVYPSSDQQLTQSANASASVKVNFNSENFDLGSDYDTGTVLFVAPKDGKYLFTLSALIGITTSDAALVNFRLLTTGGSYYLAGRFVGYIGSTAAWNGFDCNVGGSVIIDMSENDTAYIYMTMSGAALPVGVTVKAESVFTGMILT